MNFKRWNYLFIFILLPPLLIHSGSIVKFISDNEQWLFIGELFPDFFTRYSSVANSWFGVKNLMVWPISLFLGLWTLFKKETSKNFFATVINFSFFTYLSAFFLVDLLQPLLIHYYTSPLYVVFLIWIGINWTSKLNGKNLINITILTLLIGPLLLFNGYFKEAHPDRYRERIEIIKRQYPDVPILIDAFSINGVKRKLMEIDSTLKFYKSAEIEPIEKFLLISVARRKIPDYYPDTISTNLIFLNNWYYGLFPKKSLEEVSIMKRIAEKNE